MTGPRFRTSVYAVMASIVLAMLASGCDEPPLPTAPTIILQNIGNPVINNGTQPNPNASPSPPAGQCVREVIDSVRVNPFGYDCADGVTRPSNSSGLLPEGCTARVTATPKRIDGTDVPAIQHGSQITWSVPIGSERIIVTDDPEQPFNKNVRMRDNSAPGDFQLTATVCGVTGGWNGRTVDTPGVGATWADDLLSLFGFR